NLVSFPLLDAAGVVVIGTFVALTVRDVRRRGWWCGAVSGLGRLVVWGAAVYVAFALVWGVNYRRLLLESRLAFDASAITADAVTQLAASAVERLNALHDAAHARGWMAEAAIDPDLVGAFEKTTRDLGVSHVTVVARPKRTLLNRYFERAGVSG